ncbi:uncharacterized protein LOC144920893 [Branchiostoma floridae x Branchiostoma belcheri]
MSLRKAIQQHRGPVQALITEGRGILETYCSFIRGLRQNKGAVQSQRDAVLTDVAELSSVCDGAEQEMDREVASGEKMAPRDVALDEEGNLWVVGYTDPAEFAVQYNKQGGVLRKFNLQNTGWDRGVAVDTRRNHILITQTTDGTLVRTVGEEQGMKSPEYVTVDGDGNILVSDEDNHCVYVYNEDGQFLFQFGGDGSGEGQLNDPLGICTDRVGNIIVADTGNRRVEMFDKTRKFLKHIARDMTSPHAVARRDSWWSLIFWITQ